MTVRRKRRAVQTMPEPVFDVPQPGDQAKAIAESALGVLSLIAAFGFHDSHRAELRAFVKAGREALAIADSAPAEEPHDAAGTVNAPKPSRVVTCQYGRTPHPIDDECVNVTEREPTDSGS